MPRRLPRNVYAREGKLYAQWNAQGRKIRKSLCLDDDGRKQTLKEAAKRVAKLKEAALRADIQHSTEVLTWEDGVEDWLSSRKNLRPSTMKRYECSLRQWSEHLEGIAISKISTKILRNIAWNRQEDGVSNATIQRDFVALSAVFDRAIEREWIECNPVPELRTKSFCEMRRAIHLPQEASIALMLDNMSPELAAVCNFARATGMRQSEITGLEWASFEGLEGAATLYNTKGLRVRTISLATEATSILRQVERVSGSELVFLDERKRPWKHIASKFCAISRALAEENSAFVRFRFHDLRHLFAVRYLRSGGDIYDLQQIMGHSSIKVTELYLDFVDTEQKRMAQFGVRTQRRTQR